MLLQKLKAIHAALGELIVEPPKPNTEVTGTGQNVYGGGKPEGPWDPKWPGYVSGDANQFMLRKFARRDGEADWNRTIKERGIKPRFPDKAYVEKEEKLD